MHITCLLLILVIGTLNTFPSYGYSWSAADLKNARQAGASKLIITPEYSALNLHAGYWRKLIEGLCPCGLRPRKNPGWPTRDPLNNV